MRFCCQLLLQASERVAEESRVDVEAEIAAAAAEELEQQLRSVQVRVREGAEGEAEGGGRACEGMPRSSAPPSVGERVPQRQVRSCGV